MRYYYNSELYHHGIKGQKWGVRRYRNEDGSLTAEGRERYGLYKKKDLVKSYKSVMSARKNYVEKANNLNNRPNDKKAKKEYDLALNDLQEKEIQHTVQCIMDEMGDKEFAKMIGLLGEDGVANLIIESTIQSYLDDFGKEFTSQIWNN